LFVVEKKMKKMKKKSQAERESLLSLSLPFTFLFLFFCFVGQDAFFDTSLFLEKNTHHRIVKTKQKIIYHTQG